MQVLSSAPLARQIGIVRGGNETNRICSSRIEIACSVSVLLYVVRGKAVFVIYYCVMRGLDGALKSNMCLEVKVEIEALREKKRLYTSSDAVL